MNDKSRNDENAYANGIIGRDKNIHIGERGVYIGGNATGNVIQTGDSRVVLGEEIHQHFQPVYEKISESPLPNEDKADLQTDMEVIEAEILKGDKADETTLARHLRSMRRIAPDILDVALAAMQGPLAAFSAVAKKVADKIKESA